MIAKTQVRRIWQIVLVLALSFSAIIFMMMLVNASTPIAVDAEQWITECIDCSRYNYGGDLRLDENDHFHLVYGGDALYYSTFADHRWYFDIVDASPGWFLLGDFELDQYGWPNIIYTTNDLIKFARWSGSQWSIQTIPTSSGIRAPLLELDSAGNPHIVFGDINDGMIVFKYAYWTGAEWDIQTILDHPVYGFDLEIDDADNLHIGYFSNAYPITQLKYLLWNGSSWITQTIDTMSNYLYNNLSLELDQGGNPRIAYSELKTSEVNELNYASWENNIWVTQTVVVDINMVIDGISLALDSADHPHIGYSEEYIDGDGDLDILFSYVNWTGMEWAIEADIVNGALASLALDSTDTPHLIFGADERFNNDIRYGKLIDGNWDFQTIVPKDPKLGVPSMDIDHDGNLHLAYQADTELQIGYWAGDLWSLQPIVSGVTDSAVAADHDNNPYICYTQEKQLHCVNRVNGNWITPTTVISDVNAGSSRLKIQLDVSGYPHTVGFEGDVFSHIYWTGSDWATQSIPKAGGVAAYFWALDSQDKLHVLYESDVCYDIFPYTYWVITYAYSNGSAWETHEVNPCGRAYTLATDIQDQPHIIYSDDSVSHPRFYGNWDGTQWRVTNMNIHSDARDFSFEINAVNVPQIIYCSYLTPGLWFAWLPAGSETWLIQAVEQNCSPAVMAGAVDNPYISILHQGANDLILAHYSDSPPPTLPTPTPGLPWINWQSPEQPLFVRPEGANTTIEYGNLPVDSPLTATLTDSVQFVDDVHELNIILPDANGQMTFPLVPAEGTDQGDPFTLGITGTGVYLEKQGFISWAQYFPIVQR